MTKKIRIGIIFGGKSGEHEVSLQSAKNVIAALDRKKYEPILIGIDKSGRWHLGGADFLLNADDPKLIKLNSSDRPVALIPTADRGELVNLPNQSKSVQSKSEQFSNPSNYKLDVVFPVLHGTYGEDGTMQGLLKLADLPFVGPGVLGSAVGMDKDVAKRLMVYAGLSTARFFTFARGEKINYTKVKKSLGLPLFVKPANAGSSIGINKAKNEKEFKAAIKDAFQFDNKILVEEFVPGREIECAVLGNEKPICSVPGEIIPHHEFYSYEAKYIDENGAAAEIPARLSKTQVKEVQALAIKTYKILGLEGMSRVDFFLTKRGKFYVNEVNTIPGFTKISMYPKLWQASGISYPDLIDRLITLAIERYEKEKLLKTSYL